jgi:hypothetical protein
MKKILVAASFLIAGMVCFSTRSEAQIRVGLHLNIGDQPSWRSPGYDYVEYYYLPDLQAYYYVPRHQFIYMSNGRWVFSSSLPGRYSGYDLHSGYKVVVNRPNAYRYFEQDRMRYRPRNNWNDRHDNGRHRDWNRRHH